jgi:two-component system, cell cycle sensor histidine kinase and response regulator CckA
MYTRPLPAAETRTTIIIVDDADQIRDLVKKILSNFGYAVLDAKDGEACLKVCQQYPGPIHLLIADLVMTGMNGREVADHLRASRQDIKVLFMSGHDHKKIQNHGGFDAGFGFMMKPFTPETLLRKVSETLGT